MKTIRLNETIYEITEKYPEVVDIMVELGFESIKNPIVRKTAGRMMTIPEGCKKQGIDMDIVKERFIKKGYELL